MEDNKTKYEITTIVDSLEDEKLVINSNDKFGADKIDLEEIKYAIKHNSKLKEEAFFEENDKSSSQDKKQLSKEERYFFNPQLKKHYQIKMITERDTFTLDGRLSKLEGCYFLDVIPNEEALEKRLKVFMGGLTIRAHGFFKIDLSGDELIINTIEYDDFDDLIKNKKIRIEHIERDGEIIITAKTKDIQKFLIKFANEKMFNDPKEALILNRVKK
ncbi:hypothetical protein EMN46_02825 [Ancylomarina sp. 16SWW S1-10-2]|nr:hypothetical protein [Ancylomarina sp. 16SWW S1-10-2]